jgi:hypothetical protein
LVYRERDELLRHYQTPTLPKEQAMYSRKEVNRLVGYLSVAFALVLIVTTHLAHSIGVRQGEGNVVRTLFDMGGKP